MADFKVPFTDHCIPDDTYFQTTKALRRFLHQHFEEELSFYLSGKYVIVHASSVNPCDYSLAPRQGRGLSDEDFVLSFVKYVKKKVTEQNIGLCDSTPAGIIDGLSMGSAYIKQRNLCYHPTVPSTLMDMLQQNRLTDLVFGKLMAEPNISPTNLSSESPMLNNHRLAVKK